MKWIPIDDAEKPGHYQLVWIAYRVSDSVIRTRLVKYISYSETPWLTLADNVFYGNVIAWMPLENPEPPKKGCEIK